MGGHSRECDPGKTEGGTETWGAGGSDTAGEERILASLSSFCSYFASDRNVEKDASHGGVESSGCEHDHLC